MAGSRSSSTSVWTKDWSFIDFSSAELGEAATTNPFRVITFRSATWNQRPSSAIKFMFKKGRAFGSVALRLKAILRR
jgi:hypothetical protein